MNMGAFQRLKKYISNNFWLIYLMILVSYLPLYFILSSHSFQVNPDNARYLLSALAQAQAAIIAIVITLTLVAVQLSAQTYSPKVIDVFKEFADFWGMLSLYGVSIFVDIIVIYFIPDVVHEKNIGFNSFVNFSIILAFFSVTALIPYMWRTMELLKSRNLIDKLSDKINKKEFKDSIDVKYQLNKHQYSIMLLEGDKDQIVPLVDVIKKAIRSDDTTTARDGIKKLENILCELLDYDGDKKGVIKHFCEHFGRISSLSISEDNEDIIIELSESLSTIANKLVKEKNTENDLEYVVYLLAEIGEDSIDKVWKKSVESAVNSICSIYLTAGKHDVLITTNISYIINKSLDRIIFKCFENEYIFTYNIVLPILKETSVNAIYEITPLSSDTLETLKNIELHLVRLIRIFGRKSIEFEKDKVLPLLTSQVVVGLTEIGASIADMEKKTKVNDTVSSKIKQLILHMGWPLNNEIEFFLEEELISPIGDLGQVYSPTLSNDFEIELYDYYKPKEEFEQDFDVKCKWVIGLLNDIGKLLKTESLLSARQYVVHFIISIGVNCVLGGSTENATYAAKVLRDLDIDDLVNDEFSNGVLGYNEFKEFYYNFKKQDNSLDK